MSLLDAPAADRSETDSLAQTPLHALHLRLGARMVPFAGYDMPVQYPAGVLKEHLHTRSAAGLFDVSHMGQITLVPHDGTIGTATRALERLVPIDIEGLRPGRQRYGVFTDHNGGILDDLMVAHRGDHLLLVVNASNKLADAAHLRAQLEGYCAVTLLPRALLALQGPAAEAVLAALAPAVSAMRFLDVLDIELMGAPAIVSRSGYTGEDGFEIALPAEAAEAVAERLLADPRVMPVGLGARDSLRLEAGLCLHGNDIDETTTPTEAALGWAIQPVRRAGGARPGGFPGAERILAELAGGAQRRRVGLRAEGRMPVRAGASLYAPGGSEPIGNVTSGGFGPSVQAPVAMGYLPAALAGEGTRVEAEVRGQRVPLLVAHGPFVPPRFKR